MKRLLFFVAFMTLGTAGLIQLLVTEPLEPGPTPADAPQVENVLAMQDVQVHQLQGERVRWELQAERAIYNEDTKTGELEQVRFRVYDEADGGTERSVFTGRSARAAITGDPGNLVLQGDVVLNQGGELEIRSDRVEYDQPRQLITADGPVTVRTPQGVQQGKGLRYFIAEERMEFDSPTFFQ